MWSQAKYSLLAEVSHDAAKMRERRVSLLSLIFASSWEISASRLGKAKYNRNFNAFRSSTKLIDCKKYPMKPRKKPFSYLVINPCYITPCFFNPFFITPCFINQCFITTCFINPCFINPVHLLPIQSSLCFITCLPASSVRRFTTNGEQTLSQFPEKLF